MAQEALPSSTHGHVWMEIPGEDLRKYKTELLALMETVCHSPIFRNSPKSCEFLRHVVHRILAGDPDELKERLIGIHLLGRDPSYDTSTDSGVRVRANDVRKRLVKFNESQEEVPTFTITLPAGSYIPRFSQREKAQNESASEASSPSIAEDRGHYSPIVSPAAMSAAVIEAPFVDTQRMDELAIESSLTSLPKPVEAARRLTLLQLMAPTLAAIFLCIISMRWQLSQENSFAQFWQQIFQGDQALLDLSSVRAGGKTELVTVRQLNEAAPLLDLAGQFHRRLTVMGAADNASGRIVLHVGLDATRDPHQSSDSGQREAERFQLVSSPNNSRVIVDRRNPAYAEPRRAALLTIVNGAQSAIYIDGTDDEAIQSLVARLCDASTFPKSLSGSLERDTVTQAIFPLEAYAPGILHREMLAAKDARALP